MSRRRLVRGVGGRFRTPTLADVNLVECPTCGRLVAKTWVYDDAGFIDPVASRKVNCDHTDKSGRLIIRQNMEAE